MANKSWYANAITTEADLIAPSSAKAVSVASIYLCNVSTTTAANVVIKITDASNTIRCTLAKPIIPAGGTYQLGGLGIAASATPDKLRVSSDLAISCYASGDES